MRTFLMALFGLVLLAMICVTVYASLERNVFAAGDQLRASRWFQATLLDAYFGFLTFYCWVAYREPSLGARVSWFVIIMLTGNMGMAVYMLIRLWRWDPAQGASGLLLRPKD